MKPKNLARINSPRPGRVALAFVAVVGFASFGVASGEPVNIIVLMNGAEIRVAGKIQVQGEVVVAKPSDGGDTLSIPIRSIDLSTSINWHFTHPGFFSGTDKFGKEICGRFPVLPPSGGAERASYPSTVRMESIVKALEEEGFESKVGTGTATPDSIYIWLRPVGKKNQEIVHATSTVMKSIYIAFESMPESFSSNVELDIESFDGDIIASLEFQGNEVAEFNRGQLHVVELLFSGIRWF